MRVFRRALPIVVIAAVVAAPAAAAPTHPRPPLPRISSPGDAAWAMRGSYCWFWSPAPGGPRGICADYADFPHPNPRRVDAEPGDVIEIDPHHRVDGLYVSARGLRPLRGRGYRFRLSRKAKRSFDVEIFAAYPNGGDGSFAFRVVVR